MATTSGFTSDLNAVVSCLVLFPFCLLNFAFSAAVIILMVLLKAKKYANPIMSIGKSIVKCFLKQMKNKTTCLKVNIKLTQINYHIQVNITESLQFSIFNVLSMYQYTVAKLPIIYVVPIIVGWFISLFLLGELYFFPLFPKNCHKRAPVHLIVLLSFNHTNLPSSKITSFLTLGFPSVARLTQGTT